MALISTLNDSSWQRGYVLKVTSELLKFKGIKRLYYA